MLFRSRYSSSIQGTQFPCEVLKFMELEFLEKIQMELEFHELEYFTWNSSSKKKNSKSTFAIT